MNSIVQNSDGSIDVYCNPNKERKHSIIFLTISVVAGAYALLAHSNNRVEPIFKPLAAAISVVSGAIGGWSFLKTKRARTRAFQLSKQGITIYQQLLRWDDVTDVFAANEQECTVEARRSGPAYIHVIYLDLRATEVAELIINFRKSMAGQNPDPDRSGSTQKQVS